MNRRIPLVAVTAGGGLLLAAFLQAAVAAADGPTDNAFTVDGTTLDPGSDGYTDIPVLFGNAPLLDIGGGHLHVAGADVDTAEQDLTAYDGSEELGTVHTAVNASDVLGIDSAQFTVTGATSVDVNDDASASEIADVLNASDIDFSGAVSGAGDPVSVADIAAALAGDSSTSVLGGAVTASGVDGLLDIGHGYSTVDFDESGFSAHDIADALNAANGGDLLPDDGTVYSFTNLGSGIYNVYSAVPAHGDESAQISDTLVTPFGNFDIPTDFDATDPFHPTSSFAGLDVGSDGGSGGELPGSDNAFAIGGQTFDPGSDGWDDITATSGVAPLLSIAIGDLTVGLKGGGSQHLTLHSQSFDVYDGTGDDADQIGTADSYVNAANLLGIDSTQFTVSDTDGFVPVDDIQSVIGDSVTFGDDAPVSEGEFFDTLANSDIDFTGDVSSQDVINAFGPTDIGEDLGITEGFFGLYDFDADGVAPGITFDPGDVAEAINDSDLGDLEAANAAALPDDGSVYSVTNLGFGFENVYEATPNDDGDAAASISDTLVTPFGNFDVDTPFDAVAALAPGSATDGVDTAASSSGGLGDLLGGAGDEGSDGDGGSGDHAFTIGDSTFDPGSGGWDPVEPLFGVAPLMEIGGASLPQISIVAEQDLATQNLEVSNADGEQVGDVDTAVNTSNILGIQTTQFTVTDVNPAEGMEDSAALPEDGTVYSVTDLGMGIHNVYEAVPGDGDVDPTITDTLITPLGNFDLSTAFNALAELDPGNAAAGVEAGSSGGLFDGLGDIFGGGDGAEDGGLDLFGDLGSIFG